MKTLKVKFIALLLIMGGVSYNAMAQKNAMQVPQAVQTAFSAKYPQAKLKNWEKDNNQYVASFVLDKRQCQTTYASNGTWLSTETTYRHVLKHLNPAIRHELRNSNYASYHIDQVMNLQMPGKNIYLLNVDNNSGNQMAYESAGSVDDETLYFSNTGKLIKSVVDNQ